MIQAEDEYGFAVAYEQQQQGPTLYHDMKIVSFDPDQDKKERLDNIASCMENLAAISAQHKELLWKDKEKVDYIEGEVFQVVSKTGKDTFDELSKAGKRKNAVNKTKITLAGVGSGAGIGALIGLKAFPIGPIIGAVVGGVVVGGSAHGGARMR